MKRKTRLVLIQLALAASGAQLVGAAHADCTELIAALDKADREARVAVLDLHTRDQPLTGRPAYVRIGKVRYDGSDGATYRRREGGGANPMHTTLQRAQQNGTAKCSAAGTDTWRGKPATKIRFDNPFVPKSMNPTTFWIARGSGLPVYHEIPAAGRGGYAWIYGEAVKEPAAAK